MDKLERIKLMIEKKMCDALNQKMKCILNSSVYDSYDTGYEQGRINLCKYFLDEIKEIEKL
jgi:hypothetical protein